MTVYALLLCFIYKSGYYIWWDEELPFAISEQTGYDEAYIREVIKSCVTLGLFSRELFENEGVLTSRGIQERYAEICELSRRVYVIEQFNLISEQKEEVSAQKKAISVQKNDINVQKTAISATKRKVNKTKKENISDDMSKKAADAPFATDPKDDSLKVVNISEDTPPPNSAPPPSPKRFVKPTVDEIRAYCTERRNNVDAEYFYDYYESNGWKVGGRGAMKDWRAAVRTWEKNNGKYTSYGREKQQRFGATPPDDFAGKGSTKL